MAPFRATYRLQLGGGMGFAQARELLPYLRDLGVSHVYLPPSFQARAGSTHGYDVVDPGRFSEELGGEREFDALAATAKRHGLGLILDVVPNHMAADDANRYWADPELRARFFDIDERTGRHRRFFDIDHLAAVRQEDEHGKRVVDDSFLLLFNGSQGECDFRLPPSRFGQRWPCELRTDAADTQAGDTQLSAGEHLTVSALSLILLRREN